ncbi:hypothetical protein KKC17_03470 [Patescibacteria group bacterium]|nr:hypothetical protein [Patescibacteria group bacterium]
MKINHSLKLATISLIGAALILLSFCSVLIEPKESATTGFINLSNNSEKCCGILTQTHFLHEQNRDLILPIVKNNKAWLLLQFLLAGSLIFLLKSFWLKDKNYKCSLFLKRYYSDLPFYCYLKIFLSRGLLHPKIF